MAKYIYVSKNNLNQLEANDLDSERIIEKLKQGEVLKLSVSKPRHPAHHKKWRHMVDIVFNNQDIYDNEEDLITEIKLRTGHYKEHLTVKGKLIYVPKSLSFDECDQLEFEDFYNKAVNVCLKYFVKADNQELINELVRF